LNSILFLRNFNSLSGEDCEGKLGGGCRECIEGRHYVERPWGWFSLLISLVIPCLSRASGRNFWVKCCMNWIEVVFCTSYLWHQFFPIIFVLISQLFALIILPLLFLLVLILASIDLTKY